jgi:hypothetical protein
MASVAARLLPSMASRLAAGTAGLAVLMTAFVAPAARAQDRPPSFKQKEIGDQVAKARPFVFRCDKAGARREIANLKKTKEGLDAAAKTGFVEGAADDAKALDGEVKYLEGQLSHCDDLQKVTGAGKETYGFRFEGDADFAGKAVADAQRAARDCDRDLFKAVLKGLKDRAAALRMSEIRTPQQGDIIVATVLALEQLARDLESAEAELFKNCPPEPGKQAHARPGQPGAAPAAEKRSEVPKPAPSGSTPGARPGTPPRPAEPPKAPARDPEPVTFFVGAGGQFDGVGRTTLGTLFVPGNDRPFLRSPSFLTGASTAAALRIENHGLWWLLPPNLGVDGKSRESLLFRFAYSHSSASASASTGPNDIAVLTLVAPFSGLTGIGFGQADATVRASKTVYDLKLINRLQISAKANIDVGAQVIDREIEQAGTISSPTVSGFMAKQKLRTFDYFIGPVLGAGYRDTVSLGAGLPPVMVHIDGWLAPSLRISSGSARQHVVIPGAAPPFNDFRIKVERDNSGFALLGGLNATAKLPIAPNFDVGLGGSLVFNTAQSHMIVPLSPGGETRLDNRFQWSGGIQLKAVMRF